MTIFNCPQCGASLSVTPNGSGFWSTGRSFDFQPLGGSSPEQTFSSFTRTTPTDRAPTPASDVFVPLAQAAITGAVCGLAAALGAYVWHWQAVVPVSVGGGAMVLSWFWLLADHRSLLRVTETMIGAPQPEQAAPETQTTVRLEVTEHNGQNSDTMRFVDLPCSEGIFRHIAQGVLAGHPFSEREWAGSGKPISGPKFRKLQSALLTAGYIRWASQDHRQGVALTRKGEQLFRQVSEEK